jgi:hypothetical protein
MYINIYQSEQAYYQYDNLFGYLNAIYKYICFPWMLVSLVTRLTIVVLGYRGRICLLTFVCLSSKANEMDEPVWMHSASISHSSSFSSVLLSWFSQIYSKHIASKRRFNSIVVFCSSIPLAIDLYHKFPYEKLECAWKNFSIPVKFSIWGLSPFRILTSFWKWLILFSGGFSSGV